MGWAASYPAGYEPFEHGNLNDFMAAALERWDLNRAAHSGASFSDVLDWTDGDPSVTAGKYVQRIQVSGATADTDAWQEAFHLHWLDARAGFWFDPNWGTYGGPDNNGFSSLTSESASGLGLVAAPYMAVTKGCFNYRQTVQADPTAPGIDAELRTSAGLAALTTPKYDYAITRKTSRTITSLTDTQDAYGNAAAAGQRAFCGSFGFPAKCIASGNWVADNGGPVDTLSSGSAAPNNCSLTAMMSSSFQAGDIIQHKEIWSDWKAIFNVLIWVRYTADLTSFTVDHQYYEGGASQTVYDAGSGVSPTNDATILPAVEAAAAAATFSGDIGSSGEPFQDYAAVTFSHDGGSTGNYNIIFFRMKEVWTLPLYNSTTIGIEQWIHTGAPIATTDGAIVGSTVNGATLIDTFAANGATVTQDQWTEWSHATLAANPSNPNTIDWIPPGWGTAPPAWPTSLPGCLTNAGHPYCVQVAIGWQSYASTPDRANQLIRLRGDTAGGGAFAYQ